MASWFTRAIDTITPWNRKGEVQRRNERKKREDEERQRAVASAAPKVQRPQDNIGDPQKPALDLTSLKMPTTTVSIPKAQEYDAQALDNIGVQKPKQGLLNKVRDQFDANTEADKYRRAREQTQDTTRQLTKQGVDQQKAREIAAKQAKQNMKMPEADTIQDKIDIFDRSKRSIGSNFAGGLLGVAKGAVELPSFALQAPKLVRLGAAKVSGNKEAEANIAKDEGVLSQMARKYEELVRPVTKRLTTAELATDRQAEEAAPWAPGYVKPTTKALANLLPVDAVVAGLSNLNRARNVEKVFREGETAIGAPSTAGIVPRVTPQDIIENVLSDAQLDELMPRDISVGRGIDVMDRGEGAVNVPVRDVTPQGEIIQEIGGDAPNTRRLPTLEEAQNQEAAQRFAEQNFGRPDDRIEGVTPRPDQTFRLDQPNAAASQEQVVQDYAEMLRGLGEGNGVDITPDGRRVSNNFRSPENKGKRMTQADWIDEATRQLNDGNAEPGIQRAFDDAINPEVQSLVNRGEQPDVPVGRPIQVKEVESIPVRDETTVPVDLPETPGQVRVSTQTDPMKAETQAVADQPVVFTPESPIPKVGDALPDGTTVTKRQVKAARENKKNAKQLAKAQEETSSYYAKANEAKASRTPETDPAADEFAQTGVVAKGKKGNAYEVASREAEANLGKKEMASQSAEDLALELSSSSKVSKGAPRRISAAKENLLKADPENARKSELYQVLDRAEKSGRTTAAQLLALVPRVVRKTASSDELIGRFDRKLGRVLDDPSKISKEDWTQLQKSTDEFTSARDNAAKLEEKFKKTNSEADFNAWEKAYQKARDADTNARMTEADVAKRALKGDSSAEANKVLDEIRKEADVNSMDYVTANMLSGTATGFRNTFGTELAGLENRLGANTRANLIKKLPMFDGANVGGFDRKSARFGRKFGFDKWKGDAKRRADHGGKNPVDLAKNWSTTINSGGESSLQSQVYSRLGRYYKRQFEEKGLSGKQLDTRMRHAMITDPDNMGDTYLDGAMKSSGLTGMFEKGQTIEKAVTDYVGRQTDSRMGQGAAKLLMRLAVGFPTATTNFLVQSGKRLTLGMPSYVETGMKLRAGDKAGAAMAFDRAMKETGSGSVTLGLGAALGSAGLISGPYPSDPEERERWAREGISENSIKIGDSWFPIPQGAGMLGLPLLVGAAAGRDGAEGVKEMMNPKNLSKLLPTDQLATFLNMITGDGGPQDVKNFVASSVRAVTPVGALLNQIAQSFDENKNDTTTKNLVSNIFDQVAGGIPVVNNIAGIPDKKDADGIVIKNTNPLARAFGATSSSQGGGAERTAEKNAEINSTLKTIDETGAFRDSTLESILDDDAKQLYKKAKSGEQLDESDAKALKKALTKGVSESGEDTAYLEKGQYDTNLTALKVKRALMQEDPTTKPSSIKDIDTAIKRGEIYKEDKVPYELISEYKETSQQDWRNMGNPDHEDHNAEMYEKLWDLDQRMAKDKLSYRKGEPEKPKYAAKGSGKGGSGGRGGGRGGRAGSTDFGTINGLNSGPKVKEYSSAAMSGANVPVIGVKRPNIVHKITSSR